MQYTPRSLFWRKLYFGIALCFICTKITLHIKSQNVILMQHDMPSIPYLLHFLILSFFLGWMGVFFHLMRKIHDTKMSFREQIRCPALYRTGLVCAVFVLLMTNTFVLPETIIHFINVKAPSLWLPIGVSIAFLLYQTYQELVTPYTFVPASSKEI